MATKTGKTIKRKYRKGQKCPRCLKCKLEPCSCGCHNPANLFCHKCDWGNF